VVVIMAKGHAVSGVGVGLLTAPLAPWPDIPLAGTMGGHLILTAAWAALVGFFAIYPDIDHPPAVISRCVPLLAPLLCRLMMFLSRVTFEATRTAKDKPTGCHRTLTHTNAHAVVLGALIAVGLLCTPYREWAAFVGCGAALGCMSHLWAIGDSCTLSGVPHPLWPVVLVRGQRWGSVWLVPKKMRFRAGGKVGEHVATLALTIVGVLLGIATFVEGGHPWWSIIGQGISAVSAN
jgi:LexA-binding, inner membrane-associated putative hydrolase